MEIRAYNIIMSRMAIGSMNHESQEKKMHYSFFSLIRTFEFNTVLL